MTEPAREWQRLDRRMLLVHPVREVGRFLPALVVLLLFGRSSDNGGWLGVVAVAVPVLLGLLRYLTTGYRIAEGRIEVRHGFVNKQVLSTPLDRVRTVDLTASPIHRALGLVTLRVGTGSTSAKGEDRVALDGLSQATADRLRGDLLHASASAAAPADQAPAPPAPRVVLTWDPSWVRFAPFTTAGFVIAGAALGLLTQAIRTLQWTPSVDVHRLERLGLAVLVLLAVLTFVVVLCLLAVVGYVVTNFGFRLSHTGRDGAWHLRRGLFTTRETSLDDARVSGVSIGEPLGLRLVGGARLSAIVTGLDRKERGSSVLVPPAPRREVDRVAVDVVGLRGPILGDLVRHGVRARRRRWTRAMLPAGLVVLAALGAAYAVSWWFLLLAVATPAAAAVLAHDRWRSLGHALVDGHLVARSGSLDRRREVLHTPSVIGWNLRATFFQRRAGLTDLVATTAGGRQRVRVVDLGQGDAVALAHAATPGLLDQFLA